MRENTEENFLTSLINLYSTNGGFKDMDINASVIQRALDLTLGYFDNEDKQNLSNHVEIFKKILLEQSVSTQNCAKEVGISMRTFYRYKQRYLRVFKNFLIRCSNSNSV